MRQQREDLALLTIALLILGCVLAVHALRVLPQFWPF